jgi:hypothetical protein
MPQWATHRPQDYWLGADRYHRVNGRLAWLFTISLPSELSVVEQGALIKAIASHLATESSSVPGKPLVWSAAIHEGLGHNPHGHILVSVKANDGIDRKAALWFARADGSHPDRGGAPVTRDIMGRRKWLFSIRRDCAELMNQALALAGSSERVDHRRNFVRGITRLPGAHVPSAFLRREGGGHPSPSGLRNSRHREINLLLDEAEAGLLRRMAVARVAKDEMDAESAMRARLYVEYQQHVDEIGRLPLMGGLRLALQHSPCIAFTLNAEEAERTGRAMQTRAFMEGLQRSLPGHLIALRVNDRVCVVDSLGEAHVAIAADYVALNAVQSTGVTDWAGIVKSAGWMQPIVATARRWRTVVKAAFGDLKLLFTWQTSPSSGPSGASRDGGEQRLK